MRDGKESRSERKSGGVKRDYLFRIVRIECDLRSPNRSPFEEDFTGSLWLVLHT